MKVQVGSSTEVVFLRQKPGIKNLLLFFSFNFMICCRKVLILGQTCCFMSQSSVSVSRTLIFYDIYIIFLCSYCETLWDFFSL